jgi:hypothetical protein
MTRRQTLGVVALLLIAMLALLWRPMAEDSATLDEIMFVAGDHAAWTGRGHVLNVEHPPLAQLWSTIPLVVAPVALPDGADDYFAPDKHPPQSTTWKYEFALSTNLYPRPLPFYKYAALETGHYGRNLLFHPKNDTDRLLFWMRFMQALLTLATGFVVFAWARSLAGDVAGLLALTAWVFNPSALAYGHLLQSDAGLALTVPLAAWLFTRLLDAPGWRRALLAGLATGVALATKYSAVLLVPIFGLLVVLCWWKTRRLTRHLWLVPVVAWAVVLLVYCPYWSPAPPIDAADAARLKVPDWFVALRPVLIPAGYFKGLAIVLLHAARGHPAYLAGDWSWTGWWYYFPVAFLVKTPVPLLLLFGGALVWTVRQARQWGFAELAPVAVALVWFGGAMTSHANIGIRHIQPVFPLLAVALAAPYARATRATRLAQWILVAALAFVTWWTHPLHLAYVSEFAGGPADGQRWLVDSNFDWGQDAKRLKPFLDENQIPHVYTDFFGLRAALDRAGVYYTPVTPEQARQLHDVYLVVSASYLMRDKWAWLRTTHEPVARVAHTLFVYRLP